MNEYTIFTEKYLIIFVQIFLIIIPRSIYINLEGYHEKEIFLPRLYGLLCH